MKHVILGQVTLIVTTVLYQQDLYNVAKAMEWLFVVLFANFDLGYINFFFFKKSFYSFIFYYLKK